MGLTHNTNSIQVNHESESSKHKQKGENGKRRSKASRLVKQ